MTINNLPSFIAPHRHFSRNALLLIAAMIVVAVAIVYGHVVGYPFVLIDDDILVSLNPAVHGLTWAHLVYVFTHFDPELYIPLTFVS